MNTEPTCTDKVQQAAENRINDIRAMLSPEVSDLFIRDNGAVGYLEETLTANNPDLMEFFADKKGEIADLGYQSFTEYGLAFDYVPADTFSDQEVGYFRYQISYGGPSEEIRFYTDPAFKLERAEFWYMDWFDGASVIVTDWPGVSELWDEFAETGTAEHVFKQAIEA